MKKEFEQVGLFNFFEMQSMFGSFQTEESVEEFRAEDYLKKGERILTLLRRKKSRNKPQKNEILDCISYEILKQKGLNYALDRITNKWVKVMRDEILTKETETGVLDISRMVECLEVEVKELFQIELCEIGSSELRFAKLLLRRKCKEDEVRAMMLKLGDSDYLMPLNNWVGRRRHLRTYYEIGNRTNTFCVADMGIVFSRIYLLNEIIKAMKKVESLERKHDRLWCWVSNAWENELSVHSTGDNVLVINDGLLEDDVFNAWLEESGMPVVSSNTRKAMDKESLSYLYLLRLKTSKGMLQDYHLLFNLCLLLVNEYEKDKQSWKYVSSVSKNRATVWQTKKNIPDKVVEAMKNSGFNDFFGYVEFDEDVDITKVKEIEKEFRALNTIFRQDKDENSEVRFRKLGNHHASGLYYPTLNCLCVDIRCPSSMAHEFFHKIDFTHGSLSRKEEFRKVEERYRLCMEKRVSELSPTDSFYKRWEGKNSKYNKAYYFEPTEIFARCGEIYLTRILEVNNSLCKPEMDLAYPEDELLDEYIKNYYEEMLLQTAGGGLC